ncbi:MAG: hypothetical protein KHZ90_08375 [Veillonella parvula]|uniref:Uncharacterized protein n=1 Tax=Veillonella parvula TaxID=29466 RepID=A0A942WQN3_VEIPA|nr:hypothetical protein [Veillonella parvula]MBS4893776.1 hypothetical protein [Veillonella parvula]
MNKIKNIDIKDIPKIEKVLDIKLFPEVVKYLTTNEKCYFNDRCSGKTYAYIIKLILTYEGELSFYDMRYEGIGVDEWYDCSNYNLWFTHEFKEIRDKLKYHGGFDVVRMREER